jgi:hypothetical protein
MPLPHIEMKIVVGMSYAFAFTVKYATNAIKINTKEIDSVTSLCPRKNVTNADMLSSSLSAA